MGNSGSADQYGLRIIKVHDQSPASNLGLEPYFDYVVDVNEKPANFNISTDFYKLIIEHEEKEVRLIVYNQITKIKRMVPFTPSRKWPNSDFLLGFKVRYENITKAEENLYRITAVKNKRLEGHIFPNQDFFIAIDEIVFNDLSDLREKLISHKRCNVVLYNLEDGDIRLQEVDCGAGAGLGFEIASGVLHDLSLILKDKQLKLNKKNVEECLEAYFKPDEPQQQTAPSKDAQIKDQAAKPVITTKVESQSLIQSVPHKSDESPVRSIPEIQPPAPSAKDPEDSNQVDLEEEIQIEMA